MNEHRKNVKGSMLYASPRENGTLGDCTSKIRKSRRHNANADFDLDSKASMPLNAKFHRFETSSKSFLVSLFPLALLPLIRSSFSFKVRLSISGNLLTLVTAYFLDYPFSSSVARQAMETVHQAAAACDQTSRLFNGLGDAPMQTSNF